VGIAAACRDGSRCDQQKKFVVETNGEWSGAVLRIVNSKFPISRRPALP